MDLVKLLQELLAKLSEVEAAVALVAKENYDKGFLDGVASVPQSDKLYSQEELDAKLQDAIGGLKTALLVKVQELQLLLV